MNDSQLYDLTRHVARNANATERIATVLEGRQSGARVAQLDQIRQIHDEWLATAVGTPAAAFMLRIGDVLRGESDG